MFQQFFEMKTFTRSSSKILYLVYDTLNWVTSGLGTTTCFQSFGIFIMSNKAASSRWLWQNDK